MTTVQETISILKGLMVACRGMELACHESAEAAEDSRNRGTWRELAQRQGKLASELEQAVLRLGGDPRHGGLAVTKRFLWPRDSRAHDNEEPVDNDFQSSREEVQRQVYRQALQEDLPLYVHMLVQRQNVEISGLLQRMKQLGQAGDKRNARLSRAVPRATNWFDF